MLTVLGGLAEFERELIRSRASEGRERAKARGVVMGRPPKLTSHQRQEAIGRRGRGRDLGGHCPVLQCEPLHDQPVAALITT